MGCGCGKKSGATTVPVAANPNARVAAAKTAGSIMMYDVFDGEGSLVASFSNPVLARAEARRSGGTAVPRTSAQPVSAPPNSSAPAAAITEPAAPDAATNVALAASVTE